MKLYVLVVDSNRSVVAGVYSSQSLAEQQSQDIGNAEFDIEEHEIDHMHRWSWKRVSGPPDDMASYDKICVCSVCGMEHPGTD